MPDAFEVGDLVILDEGTIGIVTDVRLEADGEVLYVYDNKIDGRFDISSLYSRYFGMLARVSGG